jgi:hypothetical protein
VAGDASFDWALRDTVLPLSKACRRRSCIARCVPKIDLKELVGKDADMVQGWGLS